MNRAVRIAILYAAIAAISTAVNIGCQALAIWIYKGPFAIPLSICVGTGAGLPVKYLLDKRYIFNFNTESLKHDGKLFIIYSFTGVFTTALFWGVEFGFQMAFGSDAMRYLGGAIGLTIGYIIKYQLDKRFVFIKQPGAIVEAA